MNIKQVAVLGWALALLPSVAQAQQPELQSGDFRIAHFAMAVQMQRVLGQCQVGATPVTPAQLNQTIAQLTTQLGPSANAIRDEINKEPVECPEADEMEDFKSILTLVATRSSEEVAKALEDMNDEPESDEPAPQR